MAKKRKTEEQIRDEDERTSPMGVFHLAHSYRAAAAALQSPKLRTPFADHPVWFLYYHGIELYLKAFLRMHGHSMDELSSPKFGHRTCCLTERAAQLGLVFTNDDVEVFSLMSTTDAVIRSRYFERGYRTFPSHEALDRTCDSLHRNVGQALRQGGILVRV